MLLKIACAQPEITAGRPDLNTEKILQIIKKAAHNGADILFLPECAVPGYLIGDLWEQTSFIEDCEAYGQDIINTTADYDICVVFGNIALDRSKVNEDGRVRKYNAAFTAYRGKALGNGLIILLSNIRCPTTANLTTAAIFTAWRSLRQNLTPRRRL